MINICEANLLSGPDYEKLSFVGNDADGADWLLVKEELHRM
jgi:hypothetical protein